MQYLLPLPRSLLTPPVLDFDQDSSGLVILRPHIDSDLVLCGRFDDIPERRSRPLHRLIWFHDIDGTARKAAGEAEDIVHKNSKWLGAAAAAELKHHLNLGILGRNMVHVVTVVDPSVGNSERINRSQGDVAECRGDSALVVWQVITRSDVVSPAEEVTHSGDEVGNGSLESSPDAVGLGPADGDSRLAAVAAGVGAKFSVVSEGGVSEQLPAITSARSAVKVSVVDQVLADTFFLYRAGVSDGGDGLLGREASGGGCGRGLLLSSRTSGGPRAVGLSSGRAGGSYEARGLGGSWARVLASSGALRRLNSRRGGRLGLITNRLGTLLINSGSSRLGRVLTSRGGWEAFTLSLGRSRLRLSRGGLSCALLIVVDSGRLGRILSGGGGLGTFTLSLGRGGLNLSSNGLTALFTTSSGGGMLGIILCRGGLGAFTLGRLGLNLRSLCALSVTGNSGRLFRISASRCSLERFGRSCGLGVGLGKFSLLAVLGDGSRLAHNIFSRGGLEGLGTNKGSRLRPSGLSLLFSWGNSCWLARVVAGRGSLVGFGLGSTRAALSRLAGGINLRSSGRFSRVTVSTSSTRGLTADLGSGSSTILSSRHLSTLGSGRQVGWLANSTIAKVKSVVTNVLNSDLVGDEDGVDQDRGTTANTGSLYVQETLACRDGGRNQDLVVANRSTIGEDTSGEELLRPNEGLEDTRGGLLRRGGNGVVELNSVLRAHVQAGEHLLDGSNISSVLPLSCGTRSSSEFSSLGISASVLGETIVIVDLDITHDNKRV
ncbi:hypothetical protein HG530_013849 [Fusarium avenaceum]|nr:hypothetical protein HG530_013849 [Fusarium avenaceum]